MTLFDQRERPPAGEPRVSRNQSATTPNEPQSSRPARPTQYDRVLAVLLDRDEICGAELIRMYIPRFSAHIHKMRKAGYIITKRPCDAHDWHEGQQWLYKLEALPFDPTLPGIGDV